MGLFDRLFRSSSVPTSSASAAGVRGGPTQSGERRPPKPDESEPRRAVGLAIIGDLLTCDQPSFGGLVTSSPNEAWWLAWCEGSGDGRGGARKRANGQVLLVERATERVFLSTTALQRPNNGHCANDGAFSIEDWRFGAPLSGIFYVIGSRGAVRFRRKFNANLYSSGISPCGRFAVAQTCASPDNRDDNVLECYDVRAGKTLFSTHPRTSWAQRYRFHVEGETLQALIVELPLGSFAYGRDGILLNPDAYTAAELERGEVSTAVLAAERLLKSAPTPANAERVLASLARVVAKSRDLSTDWRAEILKVRGAALEICGDTAAAIATYEQGLSLKPKLAVKRRLTALRKAAPSS